MKQLNETFEDADFQALAEVKGDRTWREAILDMFGISDGNKSIEWRSDGVVLHLRDGRTVRPQFNTHNEGDGDGGNVGDEWIALSVDTIDECATVGPKVDDHRAWMSFKEVEDS